MQSDSAPLSLASFKSLFECSVAPMAISRLSDGHFVEANEAFARLHGYSRDELIGRSSLELQIWPRPEQRRRMLALLARHGHVRNFVMEFRGKSGRIGRALANVEVFDANGRRHLLGFLTDISDIDSTRQALLESGATAQSLAENMINGYAHCRMLFENGRPVDFIYLNVNPAFEQQTGLRNVVGHKVSEVISGVREANPELFAICGRVAQGGAPERFEIHLAALKMWFEVAAYCPQPEHFVAVFDAVTGRKLAEQALRESEIRLRVALQATRLLVFQQDRQLRYTWVANPALGMAPQDILGRSDVDIVGADGATPLLRIKRRVLRTGRGERQEVWVSREGHAGCFDLIVEPWRNAAGRIVGVLCAADDITARKHAEQELAAAHGRLEGLAVHLQDSVEAERSALARDMHDEVGAALTGIRMKLDALALRLPDGDEDCRTQLLSIAAMVERAIASTREICSRLRPPGLDDLGLAETCRWYLRNWAATTGLRASERFSPLQPEPEPAVRTDLFRILQELLTNVARHAGAAGVRVSLSGGRRGLRLRVADDGRGFAVGKEAGGFGLAGVRERVARHAGRVTIESGATGSVVTVSIMRNGGR